MAMVRRPKNSARPAADEACIRLRSANSCRPKEGGLRTVVFEGFEETDAQPVMRKLTATGPYQAAGIAKRDAPRTHTSQRRAPTAPTMGRARARAPSRTTSRCSTTSSAPHASLRRHTRLDAGRRAEGVRSAARHIGLFFFLRARPSGPCSTSPARPEGCQVHTPACDARERNHDADDVST